MSAELKQIQITGGAVDDFGNATRAGRKKRTSRKQRKEDSTEERAGPTISKHQGGTSPGTLVALQASHVPTNSSVPPPVPILEAIPKVAPAPAYQEIPLKGGVKPKVILEAPTKKSQLPKVHLAPPKAKPAHTHTKKARKIRVSLTGLGKRMTRHKSIQKEAKVMPIEKLKKILIEAKLIKPESKAPESILRQIYADYQTLKNKAL
jgi:hypothetical protein